MGKYVEKNERREGVSSIVSQRFPLVIIHTHEVYKRKTGSSKYKIAGITGSPWRFKIGAWHRNFSSSECRRPTRMKNEFCSRSTSVSLHVRRNKGKIITLTSSVIGGIHACGHERFPIRLIKARMESLSF